MEETIGYEALFSTEEWNSLDDWEPNPHQPHTVTVWYPPGEFEGNDDRYEVECVSVATSQLKRASSRPRS